MKEKAAETEAKRIAPPYHQNKPIEIFLFITADFHLVLKHLNLNSTLAKFEDLVDDLEKEQSIHVTRFQMDAGSYC